MSILLISDPHGFYSEVKETVDKIMGENDKLAVLGDILDRGSEAVKMCEYLVDLLRQDRLILIRGNHEDLFLTCLDDIEQGKIWSIASGNYHLRNGTYDSLLQLAGMQSSEAVKNPEELVHRVKESDFYKILLPACVDYYETDKYILTHGWIPCIEHGAGQRYHYDPFWREADAEEWRKARWYNGMQMAHKHQIIEPDKVIVCGHWHTSYGHSVIEGKCGEYGEGADFSPYFAKGIIAIDGCIAHTGKVNCVVIDE